MGQEILHELNYLLNFNIMKEIMNEIDQRFAEALQSNTSWGKNTVLELYRKISSEVYLEKLSLLMERN